MMVEPDREDQLAQFEAQKEELERLIARIAHLRRLLDCPDPDPRDIEAEADACAQARCINEHLNETADRILREYGIDPDLLDEQQPEQKTQRLWRKDLTTDAVPTTGDLDDILPNALDQILSNIPLGWLRQQRSIGARLAGDYLRQPVCLTMGSRPESEQSPVHRFAQSLLVSEDHLNRENWLDFHAGALLIPIVTMLGNSVELLKEVPGAMRRLHRLVRLPSDQVDSAMYELLVAVACVRKGLRILMPTEGTEPTTDIRVKDQLVPIVLECKMQRYLSDSEKAEVTHMRPVCEQIIKVAREEGRAIAVELVILAEIDEIQATEILPFVRKAWEASCLGSFQVARWGSVRASPLSPYMLLPEATRLYSPFFMENVFGWQPEDEEWDGICARVSTRREIITEEARTPVCVRWRSESAKSLRMRVRGQMRWLERAFRQIRGGEMGVIYLAYREGRRQSVADAQTRACLEESKDMAHRRSIQVPAIILNRVYARALGHGNPDLIENAIVGRADYADPGFPDLIPWSIFTPSTLSKER